MTFNSNSTYRARRTEILAGTTSDAFCLVDYRDEMTMPVIDHRYCPYRTMTGTTATGISRLQLHATLPVNNSMTYLDFLLVYLSDRTNCSGRTYLRTLGTLRTTEAQFV